MQTLTVRIISPSQVIFEGQALAVSSKNIAGNFDILPEHANFITVIKGQPITVHTTQNKSATFNLPLAIIYVTGDKVNIYTYSSKS